MISSKFGDDGEIKNSDLAAGIPDGFMGLDVTEDGFRLPLVSKLSSISVCGTNEKNAQGVGNVRQEFLTPFRTYDPKVV